MKSKLSILMLAAAHLATAGATAPPEAFTLRYRFRPGQVDRYNVDLTFSATSSDGSVSTPAPARGSSTSTLKVQRVRPDGVAVIQATLQGFQMLGPGGARGTDQAFTYTLTPLGAAHILSRPGSLIGNAFGAIESTAAARLGVALPERTVKPGDTWTSTIADPAGGKTPIRVSSRLFSVTSAHGRVDARIHQFFLLPLSMNLRQPGSGTPTRVTGIMVVTSATDFSPTLGKVVRNSVSGRARLRLAESQRPSTAGSNIQIQMKTDIVVDLAQ